MPNPLASSWAKLDRGKEHLDSLRSAVEQTINANPLKGKVECDFERHLPDGRAAMWFTWSISHAPVFTREDHGVILGDCMTNFRAVFDHAIWSLVKREGVVPVKTPEVVQLPRVNKSLPFSAAFAKRVPGVCAEKYGELISRYQPYRRTPAGRAMRALHEFVNNDKHRVIVPILVFPASINLVTNVEATEVLETEWLFRQGQQLKTGTKVVRECRAGTPGAEIKPYAKFRMTFDPELPKRRKLFPTLDLIAATGTQFLSELEALL